MIKLLLSFYDKYHDAYSALSEFAAHDNIDAAKHLAHSIKGSGANLGLLSLAEKSAHIEELLKQYHWPDLELCAEFQAELKKLDDLKPWLAEVNAELAPNTENHSTNAGNENLLAQLTTLSGLIYRDIPQSQDLITELISHYSDYAAPLAAIKNAIFAFDLDSAEQQTKTLIQQFTRPS